MGLLWITASPRRTDSVANLLTYKPTDGATWAEVHDNYDWDHPKMRDLVEDVRRNGVKEPVMVDYENTPPTVEDGHTRVLAAHRAGVTHVPVRQGSSFDLNMERVE